MDKNVIEIINVSMRFNLSKEKVDSLKEYFVKFLRHQIQIDEFFALKNINIEIKRGESFAVVGENGSGKSTLLKIISGIFYPTTGSVNVQGTISPLIELGAGFDMDLTARENVYLNGAILGYSKKFMDEQFQQIMDFAELWDFVDVPVKNFSSGMAARLGFSIAMVVVPDILIVDEILAVGDFMFQQKCEKKMQEMLEQGTTLIFVSHSSEQVKKLCKRAIWLKHGIPQMIGDASEVCDAYTYDMEHGGHGIVSEEIHEQRTETMEMQAMDPFSAPPLQKKQYQFIHWIRAVAVCLIIWCHLGWMWLGQAQISCKLNDMINGWIFNPLAIREGAGSLGVFLFFACSGFVITHSLSEENRRSFAVKRLFRIYPAIISSFVLVFLGTMLCLFITKSPVWWEQYPITVWLENAFMINSFFNSNPVIIPPMWFLFIEMIFYAVCFLLLPLLKRKPNIALTAELLLCLAAIFTVGLGGDVYIRIASAISYLPYLIFGQLVYYWWNGRITTRISGIFFAIIYYLIVKNIYVFYPEYYGAANSYGVSFIYTVCIFMICLMLNYRIKSNTIIRKISNWSYSIYLLHMPIGQMVLLLLHQKIGYPLAFTTALIVIFALSYLQYTFVEKAFIKLGKKLY